MKVTKDMVLQYRDEVLSAYNYYWDKDTQLSDMNHIRTFFSKCVQMEYTEFITKLNDEYGALLENYRQAKNSKSIAVIKGVLGFFLIMYIIGIIIAAIVFLSSL